MKQSNEILLAGGNLIKPFAVAMKRKGCRVIEFSILDLLELIKEEREKESGKCDTVIR